VLDKLTFPNVRKIFVPDPGHHLFEADLKGADAQVVAWEAEDEELKAAFRAGIDVHTMNAEQMFGLKLMHLDEKDPARVSPRKKAKTSVHAANYLVSPRTLSANSGMLMIDAEKFIARWFQIHPRIKTHFHGKIERSLATTKSVSNAFGYTIRYFDRIEQCLTNAVAWIPQSTVALVSTYGAVNAETKFPGIFNLQVHDSLLFQLPSHLYRSQLSAIGELLKVTIPYPDPLVIPWELKTSPLSWGECKGCDWNGNPTRN
jgi:DNA polymerase-1